MQSFSVMQEVLDQLLPEKYQQYLEIAERLMKEQEEVEESEEEDHVVNDL